MYHKLFTTHSCIQQANVGMPKSYNYNRPMLWNKHVIRYKLNISLIIKDGIRTRHRIYLCSIIWDIFILIITSVTEWNVIKRKYASCFTCFTCHMYVIRLAAYDIYLPHRKWRHTSNKTMGVILFNIGKRWLRLSHTHTRKGRFVDRINVKSKARVLFWECKLRHASEYVFTLIYLIH